MTENQPKKVNNKKTRGYALVIYPESLPKNFIERINDLHMQCLLSPLHDKDVDPNGQPSVLSHFLCFYHERYPLPLISIVSPRYVGSGLNIILMKSLGLAKNSLIISLLLLFLRTSSEYTPKASIPSFLPM